MANEIPRSMHAVLLLGHGGPEQLSYRTDAPVPRPGHGEVLIRVAAAGINNTDINTRVGWYSKSMGNDTTDSSLNTDDASWSGEPLRFPRIQGADCCGRIVALGEGVDQARLGERVLVRSLMQGPTGQRPFECWTFGSECDGGFAQYTTAPTADVWAVKADAWTDIELASIPCSYSTAEGMLHRARVTTDDSVLIRGASGGVGSAAVQLAKCRGAKVIAVAGAEKAEEVKALGADLVIPRNTDLIKALGKNSVTVVADLVGGKQWPTLLELLRLGGRYAVAGAIAGPLVELDLRTLYLRDLTFFGCTWQEDAVFDNLVQYIEENRIKPLVGRSYPLSEVAVAQKDFMEKRYAGKLVLLPP